MGREGTTQQQRWLRRANRRLRWKKNSYVMRQVAVYAYRPSVRRDVVVRLIQTRQWRLAVTVAVMPNGYSLTKADDRCAREATRRMNEKASAKDV